MTQMQNAVNLVLLNRIVGSYIIERRSPIGKYCFSQKLLTGELSTAHGYIPPCLSHKERQHAVQEHYEVRSCCRRGPRQQKWSGAPPHPPPGGRPFQGPMLGCKSKQERNRIGMQLRPHGYFTSSMGTSNRMGQFLPGTVEL